MGWTVDHLVPKAGGPVMRKAPNFFEYSGTYSGYSGGNFDLTELGAEGVDFQNLANPTKTCTNMFNSWAVETAQAQMRQKMQNRANFPIWSLSR